MMDLVRKAWTLIKRYWQFFIGLAIGLLLFLFSIRPRPKPLIPTQDKLKDDADKKEQDAADERDQVIDRAKNEHDKQVDKVVSDIIEKEPILDGDPKKTNDFLHEVGKSVRGER
jgi:hypothetical protein